MAKGQTEKFRLPSVSKGKAAKPTVNEMPKLVKKHKQFLSMFRNM